MTITATDVKLLASERFTDDADGGGFMTATVITDGVENNVFPDISDVERAIGNNAFRKVYAAVLTATAEQYRSAHVIIDTIPSDPGVTGFLHASADVSEDRAGMIVAANASATGTQDGGPGWYSTKPIKTAGAPGNTSVKLDGITLPLIPVAISSSAVSGAVVSTVGATVSLALVAAGAPLAPAMQTVVGGQSVQFTFATPVFPGSVSGSYHETAAPANTHTVSDAMNSASLQTLTAAGATVAFQNNLWPGDGTYTVPSAVSVASAAVTNDSVVYTPAFPVSLPQVTTEFTWTLGMSLTQFVTLPYESEPGSEVISFTSIAAGTTLSTRNNGNSTFQPVVTNLVATINRGTRLVSLFFSVAPQVGSKVKITFARSGFAQSLGIGAVSGAFSANQLHVTPSAGFSLRAALFTTSTGATYTLREDNSVYLGPSVVGSYSPTTGNLQIPIADGTTITAWRAVEVNSAIPIVSVTDAPLPPSLSPATVVLTGTKSAGGTFTATANTSGAFATAVVTGTYNKLTGKVNLTFSEAVASESLQYSATQQAFTPVSADVSGVNPSLFPTSGEVPVFRVGDLVILHNTQSLAPQTVANAQTVNVGRTNVNEFRVIGANGAEIFTGWTGNKTTGVVTFNNVTGYSQPVTVTHRIEEIERAISVTVDGVIGLSNALTKTFPADTSYLSSALMLGDMFSRVHGGFQLATWADVWADTATGLPITADYNEAAHPIQITNDGAITERWAIKFTSTTSFTVAGEQVGVIATGNTANDCAPMNPATGAPYFTIPAVGWGTGWAQGNAYRFNTTGASSPFWTLRSIKPSAPSGADKITVALRGSVNA